MANLLVRRPALYQIGRSGSRGSKNNLLWLFCRNVWLFREEGGKSKDASESVEWEKKRFKAGRGWGLSGVSQG